MENIALINKLQKIKNSKNYDDLFIEIDNLIHVLTNETIYENKPTSYKQRQKAIDSFLNKIKSREVLKLCDYQKLKNGNEYQIITDSYILFAFSENDRFNIQSVNEYNQENKDNLSYPSVYRICETDLYDYKFYIDTNVIEKYYKIKEYRKKAIIFPIEDYQCIFSLDVLHKMVKIMGVSGNIEIKVKDKLGYMYNENGSYCLMMMCRLLDYENDLQINYLDLL